ncbi:restriction endonuclease subunit S [Rhodanobacter sp. KK11]|uniref:restriction endonuclease subunit S n=1 Tax=Rhodanobacter sp. KK11 TaxID=3083255 RepID=UPI002966FC96|nr:restriction endonuclease subunit S [Rhodanobacter sp. KK11]MDW2982635.1 restriction endonuclease subunit S [Rhodanobacter sp. KK11]
MADVTTLAEACRISTGKLDANAAVHGGSYPFFTCAETPSRIDSYAYDGCVILVAGNNAQGRFHVSRYDGKFNAYQRTYILEPRSGFERDYLYYSLKLALTGLRGSAQGSQTKFLTMPILTSLAVAKRNLTEQRRAVAILSALDAKIDLNHRINAELEALAKTIYDYWFVQFDFPDAHGRPYKSSGGAMVWNDTLKREIPAGWEAAPLSRLVEEVKDGVTPNAFDTTTPYIGLEHIARKSIVLSAWATADRATSNKITFRKGDILFGKIRPYFHKVALAMMEGIVSTDAIVMRPRQRGLAAFALETIFSDRFVETATASSTGSKMPRADWKVMRNYGVAIPGKSSSVADGYQKLFDGIASKIENNVRQNRELTQLRDWLLPLLMNGQVRVA